jgi:hypothetical protein
VASGCGVTPDDLEGNVEQALTSDFVDASGAVTVRITRCPATSSNELNAVPYRSIDRNDPCYEQENKATPEDEPQELLPDARLR